MDKIVEAVARVRCDQSGYNPDDIYDATGQPMWQRYEDDRCAELILAVLKAIEEPTDQIIVDALSEMFEPNTVGDPVQPKYFASIWKAMLNALTKSIEQETK